MPPKLRDHPTSLEKRAKKTVKKAAQPLERDAEQFQEALETSQLPKNKKTATRQRQYLEEISLIARPDVRQNEDVEEEKSERATLILTR